MFFVTLRLSGMPYVHRQPCIFFWESCVCEIQTGAIFPAILERPDLLAFKGQQWSQMVSINLCNLQRISLKLLCSIPAPGV